VVYDKFQRYRISSSEFFDQSCGSVPRTVVDYDNFIILVCLTGKRREACLQQFAAVPIDDYDAYRGRKLGHLVVVL
jgi:hypothetical protein